MAADFWKVVSASGWEPHIVRRLENGEWRCDCKDFFYRKRHCRHIIAAQGWFVIGWMGTRDNPAFISVPIPPERDIMILRPDFEEISSRYCQHREITRLIEYAKEIENLYEELRKEFFMNSPFMARELKKDVQFPKLHRGA